MSRNRAVTVREWSPHDETVGPRALRAGDKGDTSILSMIAYDARDYPLIVEGVSVEAVRAHLVASCRARSSVTSSIICAR